MAKKVNEYDLTKLMLETLRPTNTGRTLLKEEDEKKDEKKNKYDGAIAITDDPKFGQNVLSSQIEQFKSAVDSGAEFSDVKEGDDVADNPLIYIPENKNLIFSGVIPRLNNLKFQFLLKTDTGDGLFIWADGAIVNNENLKTLSKLYGFYQNWCEAWNAESKDFETIVNTERNRNK